MKYKYAVHGWDDKHDLETNFESPEFIAEEAAEDYYERHDGWECDWPIKLEIFNGEESMGIFEIELVMSPSFESVEVD